MEAKGVLGDSPIDYNEGRRQERSSLQVSLSVKLRVIASYVILTLLSAYVIYDYKIRPDCICRPRPYIFAISAFGLTGLYGIMGILNRSSNKPCPDKGISTLLYVLEMSLVLPLFASEIWAVEKTFRKHPEMVHMHMAAAIPGIASYLCRNEQKPWMMDISLAYSLTTLLYLGVSHYSFWAAIAGILFTFGYFYAERPSLMPRIDFMHDEEIINYCLSGFLLTYPKLTWLPEMIYGMEVIVFSVVLSHLAAEMWAINKFIPSMKCIPYMVQASGYPAVIYYYFFHKPLPILIEGVLMFHTFVTFTYMFIMKKIIHYIGTAAFIYVAYFSKLRYNKIPLPECRMTKQESINYSLSASILCASISMI